MARDAQSHCQAVSVPCQQAHCQMIITMYITGKSHGDKGGFVCHSALSSPCGSPFPKSGALVPFDAAPDASRAYIAVTCAKSTVDRGGLHAAKRGHEEEGLMQSLPEYRISTTPLLTHDTLLLCACTVLQAIATRLHGGSGCERRYSHASKQ